MKPAPHANGKFQTEELTIEDLREIVKLPYDSAMQMLYDLTGVKKSKSRYFTPVKIELWTIMPEFWRLEEVINFIETESELENAI